MRGGGRIAALMAAGLVLAGCGTTTTTATTGESAPAPGPVAGYGPAPPPMRAEPAALAPSLPRPLRPGLPDDLARLRGMDAAAVRAALGEPTLLRRDIGARVWQYFGRDCVLDVFLYPDDGVWRVLHHHLRGTAAATVSRECLQQSPRGLHPILRQG